MPYKLCSREIYNYMTCEISDINIILKGNVK